MAAKTSLSQLPFHLQAVVVSVSLRPWLNSVDSSQLMLQLRQRGPQCCEMEYMYIYIYTLHATHR